MSTVNLQMGMDLPGCCMFIWEAGVWASLGHAWKKPPKSRRSHMRIIRRVVVPMKLLAWGLQAGNLSHGKRGS